MKNSGKILSGLRGLGPPYCRSRIFARVFPRAQSGIEDLLYSKKKKKKRVSELQMLRTMYYKDRFTTEAAGKFLCSSANIFNTVRREMRQVDKKQLSQLQV